MKLYSPDEVAEITGLPYHKALLLIKSANYIRMGNRYYISARTLDAAINPKTPVHITTEN